VNYFAVKQIGPRSVDLNGIPFSGSMGKGNRTNERNRTEAGTEIKANGTYLSPSAVEN